MTKLHQVVSLTITAAAAVSCLAAVGSKPACGGSSIAACRQLPPMLLKQALLLQLLIGARLWVRAKVREHRAQACGAPRGTAGQVASSWPRPRHSTVSAQLGLTAAGQPWQHSSGCSRRQASKQAPTYITMRYAQAGAPA